MGLVARKPVFGLSDKASFKPVSSTTETSYKIEISSVGSQLMILSKKWIIKALIRLRGCAGWSAPLLLAKPPKTGFLVARPKWCNTWGDDYFWQSVQCASKFMVNVLKLWTLFLFLFPNKVLVISTWSCKMLVWIANRGDPDQTAYYKIWVCTYFRLWLTTTLLEWFSGREENDCRNYFMINLHKSMGPGWDGTSDLWICSQTCICYRLHCAAHSFIL